MTVDLSKLPQLPQRQDSVTEQITDLISVATKLGMYDASDLIRSKLLPGDTHKWRNTMSEHPWLTQYTCENCGRFCDTQDGTNERPHSNFPCRRE